MQRFDGNRANAMKAGLPGHEAKLQKVDWELAWNDNRNNKFSAEKERQKWWRQRFRLWATKWLNQRWIIPPKPLGGEDFLFAMYPAMKNDWEAKKRAIQAIIPADCLLLETWNQKRKKQFIYRCLDKEEDDGTVEDKEIDQKENFVFCHLRHDYQHWSKMFYIFGFVEVLFLFFTICLYKFFRMVLS